MPGSAPVAEKRKAKSVSASISERKGKLASDEEKTKDEDQRENTPLQVVETFRDVIRETQAARSLMVRAKGLLDKTLADAGATTEAGAKKVLEKQAVFYKQQLFYWTQIFATRRTEMTDMQQRYGAGLEQAHREFVGDFVEFYHFKKKFAALAAVERAVANYVPPMLGLEKGKKPGEKRTQAIAAETLASEPAWSFDEFRNYVPPQGEEEDYTREDVNILDELAFAFGDEDAQQVAEMIQEHFQEHDEPEAQATEELDISGASLAELQQRQETLLGECEELWEHPAVQSLWFERNLHEMILARLREERVLELPSTIKLLNQIARIERNHPNTTVGVALVGDPGVGKTTVIEHYLRKKNRSYVYIDMTEEVTRYTLLGSPAVHTESQMDFYRRMSEDYGNLEDEDVLALIKRNAEKLEKGFGALSAQEREVLAVGMMREQLEKAERLGQGADPALKALLEKEITERAGSGEGAQVDQEAVSALKDQVMAKDPKFSTLLSQKMQELQRTLGEIPEAELEVAAQRELVGQIEDTHTSLRLSADVSGKLGHVKEALSRVARIKYQDEVAEKFADLTKKNGWRDGLVIHALRTGKSILFDEYNAAADWKLLHHLFTLKPGDTYIFGDKAGEEIKIPDDWRMYFTANIGTKHVATKLKEALVSRIGGQVLQVEPPPSHEEWLVTVASLSDANDRIVRDEKDMVQLGFLINDLLPKIREALRNSGSPNIVPISFRMIGNITEQLMNHRTQFARPTSVDRAVLDEMVKPYIQYADTTYPVKGGDTNQTPSLIVKYLVEAGVLLTPEVEEEVIKWIGISKEELDKKRDARKDQDWRKLMKEIQAKAQGAMTEMMPSAFVG